MEEKIKQLEKQLQIEMNAKNKAYYFILSQGCLPVPSHRHMAQDIGLEPMTYCLEGSCSIQLS